MKRIHLLTRLCSSWALAVLLVAFAAGTAMAAPEIKVTTLVPDYVTPERPWVMDVGIRNVGDTPMTGNLTMRFTFPVGVSVGDVFETTPGAPSPSCTPSGQVNECQVDLTGMPPQHGVGYRTFSFVDSGAAGELTGGQIEISGGGASNTVSVPYSVIAGPTGPFDVKSFDVAIQDNPRYSAGQAGSVPPELVTTAEVRSAAALLFGFPIQNFTVISAPESFRHVVVHAPPGFVGYPTATPVRCTAAQLEEPAEAPLQVPICPRDSQIGLALINAHDLVPVYNIVPPRGAPAEFGFYYQGLIVTLRAKVRASDNGIDIITERAPSSVPVPRFEVTLWGVPSDSSHDNIRAECTFAMTGANGSLCPSLAPRAPLLRMPTSCSGNPLQWSIDLDTYQHPETFHHADATTPAVSGCGLNPFDPSLTLVPSTLAPHASSGVDTTLTMPQDFGPNGLAPADIRRVSVTLPDGMTINPSSADGLQACGDGDLKLRQDGAATCPDASKLGTVAVRTPLLDHSIGGSVFVRTQNSDDPASGELFRLAIELRSDDDGIDIKLPGSIRVDPSSGQMTTVFDDLPQMPIESMDLHFKTGPRAPLATPSTCGVHTTEVDFLSWGDRSLHGSSSFAVSGCQAARFAPTLRAGVESPVAGSSSPFRVRISRTDDDQQFRSVTIDSPKGLLARVKDAVQCSNAAANANACPDGSLVGHATVGAGVGSNPFYVTTGRVYFTGPYRGAPFGLAVAVHAVAGPFDLGTVVVRQAIEVNPRTTQISVVSDPFPTILKGVPLRIRSIRVSIDKPHFMVNPTNCSVQQVGGTATSVDGASASLASRFQVGGCKSLKFAPRLSLSVGSRGHTGSGISTPFKAVLTQTPGQSNMKSVKVVLPQTLAALLNVVNRACTLNEYKTGRCAKARAGSAVAKSPLLKDPLRGGAFFVKHPGRPLPDLMVALRGDISIDLVGRVTIPGGTQLATNFDAIPDAPVSKFTLSIVSGSHGPLGVSHNLCTKRGKRATAEVQMRGQNGDVITRHQRLHIRGCGGGGHRR